MTVPRVHLVHLLSTQSPPALCELAHDENGHPRTSRNLTIHTARLEGGAAQQKSSELQVNQRVLVLVFCGQRFPHVSYTWGLVPLATLAKWEFVTPRGYFGWVGPRTCWVRVHPKKSWRACRLSMQLFGCCASGVLCSHRNLILSNFNTCVCQLVLVRVSFFLAAEVPAGPFNLPNRYFRTSCDQTNSPASEKRKGGSESVFGGACLLSEAEVYRDAWLKPVCFNEWESRCYLPGGSTRSITHTSLRARYP